MVSGLVTSPCDQLRIFSGEARLMRMASKSAITFAISNGLERNKVFLRFLLSRQLPVVSGQLPVFMFRSGRERSSLRNCSLKFFSQHFFSQRRDVANYVSTTAAVPSMRLRWPCAFSLLP